MTTGFGIGYFAIQYCLVGKVKQTADDFVCMEKVGIPGTEKFVPKKYRSAFHEHVHYLFSDRFSKLQNVQNDGLRGRRFLAALQWG